MNLSEFTALPAEEKEAVYERVMRHSGLVQDVTQLKLRVKRLEEIVAKLQTPAESELNGKA